MTTIFTSKLQIMWSYFWPKKFKFKNFDRSTEMFCDFLNFLYPNLPNTSPPPSWRRKRFLFLPGGAYFSRIFLQQNLVTFWDKKIKKKIFGKNIFSKIIFGKIFFFPILFFTGELSHFVGQKNQKNIFFKFFSKIWKKFLNFFFN